MTVKGFMDGTRFCLVFENISDKEVNALTEQFNVKIIEPVNAKPMPGQQDEEDPVKELLNVMTDKKAQPAERDRAFKELSDMVGEITAEKRSAVAGELNGYLGKRFAGIDPDAYANKLTDRQCETFISLFASVIPKKAKETDDMRLKVASTIRRCNKIAETTARQ